MLHDLALDDAEVAELLPPDRRTAALRRQARGWPAVLGLAAYATAADVPLDGRRPLGTRSTTTSPRSSSTARHVDVQRSLTALSVLCAADRRRTRGLRRSGQPAPRSSRRGSPTRPTGEIEVHPLARDFLLAKLRIQPDVDDVLRAAFASRPSTKSSMTRRLLCIETFDSTTALRD